MSEAVRYESRGDIGVITLDRPDNRNSMTPELLDAFTIACAAARADHAARVVVITGTGSCFSSGADFKSVLQREGDTRARTPDEKSYAMYEPFLGVLDLEVPVIAACNGHTVGGGFGLALVCDLRIGAAKAKYGANFAKLGLHPGLAISYLLPRIVGAQRAAEMLFTARLVDGEEAARLGILLEAVADDQVLPRAMALARTIADNAPTALRLTKRTFYRGLGWDVRAGARAESTPQAITLATADAQEGIAALLEKRAPKFTGR
ncbi:MAG TPA: enoyl-CoA hydratase/isomerase family protein [Kofleriaceae bacterium]|nr:enoyl-CoA hydratase/isomerase family protein [Kofleriaceae bacterium]